MARGQRDYGAMAAKEVTASVSDLGEIAARLGSIVTFDKRGDVVDFDNFEAPVLKWKEYESNGAVYLYSLDVKSGSQSVALSCEANSNAKAGILKQVSLPPSKRLGFEISCGGTLTGELYVEATYYGASSAKYAKFKIDFDNDKVYIYDGDTLAYVEIADLLNIKYEAESHLFYTLKLVVDFDTAKYVRAMFGSYEWDISDYNVRTAITEQAPYLYVWIYRKNTSAVAAITSVEDYVLTQAEP